MSEEILNYVGKYYGEMYDHAEVLFRKIAGGQRFSNIYQDNEDWTELLRELAHASLIAAANTFEVNDVQEEGAKFVVVTEAEEYRNVDSLVDPIVGWLNSVDEGIAFQFSESPAPKNEYRLR